MLLYEKNNDVSIPFVDLCPLKVQALISQQHKQLWAHRVSGSNCLLSSLADLVVCKPACKQRTYEYYKSLRRVVFKGKAAANPAAPISVTAFFSRLCV